ncbi:MAG: phage major capsid protein [Methylocystis sp.]
MSKHENTPHGARVIHRFLSGEVAADPAASKSSRTITFTFASPGAVRGDDHQLQPGAWVQNWRGSGRDGLSAYRRNPVILEAHDASGRAVGKCTSIREMSDGCLVGSIEFAETEAGDELLSLYLSGAMSACSIGWIPVEGKRSTSPNRYGGLDVSKAELLEISLVSVPADANALVAGRSMTGTKERAERARIFAMPRAHAASFNNFGENMQAIAHAASGGEIDNRLVRAPLGGGEVDPSTGGFMVQEQFVEGLIGSLYEEAVIAPLCDRRTTDKPLASTKVPAVDETSRADGSRWGASLAFWEAEGASVSAAFPRWRQLEFSAKKLIGICIASEELVGDTPMLGAHLTRAFASEIGFKLDLAILAGAAGTPLGILNSPALITIPKASGQASATIVKENVDKMWSALPAPCRKRAVWLCNEDAITQIDAAQSGQFSGVFIPAGAAGNAAPLLKGRPVVEVEQSPALGSVGDIVLADLSQYIIVDGGLKSAISADVYFISGQAAFRFVLRVDGMPAWASPITAYNGTGSRSPFVTLAAR